MKIRLAAVLVALAGLFVSCATHPTVANPYRPLSEQGAHVLGIVHADFTSFGVFGTTPNARRKATAHAALLEAARREHSGTIDVVNIHWNLTQGGAGFGGSHNLFSATGTVISLDQKAPAVPY